MNFCTSGTALCYVLGLKILHKDPCTLLHFKMQPGSVPPDDKKFCFSEVCSLSASWESLPVLKVLRWRLLLEIKLYLCSKIYFCLELLIVLYPLHVVQIWCPVIISLPCGFFVLVDPNKLSPGIFLERVSEHFLIVSSKARFPAAKPSISLLKQSKRVFENFPMQVLNTSNLQNTFDKMVK